MHATATYFYMRLVAAFVLGALFDLFVFRGAFTYSDRDWLGGHMVIRPFWLTLALRGLLSGFRLLLDRCRHGWFLGCFVIAFERSENVFSPGMSSKILLIVNFLRDMLSFGVHNKPADREGAWPRISILVSRPRRDLSQSAEVRGEGNFAGGCDTS